MNFRWSWLNVTGVAAAIAVGIARPLKNVVPEWAVWVLIAVAFTAGSAMVVVNVRERLKRKAFADWAKKSGFEHHDLLSGHPFGLTTFPFGQSGKGITLDLVKARWGDQALAFAFTIQYTKSRLESRRSAQYQIVAIRLPYGLPTVQWIPLDTVSTAAVMAGGQKIDFESAEFNANWRVMGQVPQHVHEIVHPRLMERLNQPDAVGRPFVLEKDVVFTWSARRQSKEEIVAGWRVLGDIFAWVPRHVWLDRGFHVRTPTGTST